MGKTLLVLTTANQLEYTKKTIQSFKLSAPDFVDLLVIDDHSIDGTPEYCKNNDIQFITKRVSKGVTHSWNIGYSVFKERNYNYLILANNDILIPFGAIKNFIKVLENHVITSVLCNRSGVPFDIMQAIDYNFDLSDLGCNPEDFENYQKVQDFLSMKQMTVNYKLVHKVNGFFFGVNRKICEFELDDSNLFNPKLLNVDNEYELCRRVKNDIAVCLNAFIFHYKGISFKDHDIDSRYNFGRQLTWQVAKKLKENKLKRFLYRLRINTDLRFGRKI